MSQELTTADLDQMARHPDWGGFGYLGERELVPSSSQREQADAFLLEYANARGVTVEGLFAWANSKRGRHYGDCWFGNYGRFAEKYLPH